MSKITITEFQDKIEIPDNINEIIFEGKYIPEWVREELDNKPCNELVSIRGKELIEIDLAMFFSCWGNIREIITPIATLENSMLNLKHFVRLQILYCEYINPLCTMPVTIKQFVSTYSCAYKAFNNRYNYVVDVDNNYLSLVHLEMDRVELLPSNFKFPPNIEYLSLMSLNDVDVSYLNKLKHFETKNQLINK